MAGGTGHCTKICCMYLQIHDLLTVGEIEERFNECFPFLNIAFYSKPHNRFEGSGKEFRHQSYVRIGDIRRKHLNQAYEIKSWFTVSKIERELKEFYGLNAQIFRYDLAGHAIQTTLSDDLTLQQQKQFAEEPGMNF